MAGAKKKEAEKKERKRSWFGVRCVCLVLLLAVSGHLLQEALFVVYVILEAWNDGIPLGQAIKDAVFELSEINHLWFVGLNFKSSKVQISVEESDDHVTAICKTSLYLKPTEVSLGKWSILDTNDPATTEERMAAYLDACREVYKGLDPAHRAVLDDFLPPLGVPAELPNITAPYYHGPMDDAQVATHRMQRNQVAAERPDLSPRWTPVEELEPEWQRGTLAKGHVRPVKEQVIRGSEVADAIRQGKVARFDATELLPKELFNLSIPDIARLHGDLAKEIQIYRQRGPTTSFSSISLEGLAHRVEMLKKVKKLYHQDQRVLPRSQDVPPPPTTWWLRLMRNLLWKVGPGWMKVEPEVILHSLRRILLQPTINVRRFPKLPHFDLKEAMGNPPWLERVWSMLWCGAVGSWWHNDEPDNLLIALNGEMTVAVFENQNDTDILSGMRGPVHMNAKDFDLAGFDIDAVNPGWLVNNLWLTKFPYIRVHLKPGMGVTVPSRTYHTIIAEDSDRLLLNAFMMPKYKAMEDAPAGKGSFFGAGRQPEIYMALFHLKFSSCVKLWETRRLGGFFEMTKLEIF